MRSLPASRMRLPEPWQAEAEPRGKRAILQSMAALPIVALLGQTRGAAAQPAGTPSPVRVDTKGLAASIKFEQFISGPLTDLNGKFKCGSLN